MIQGQFKQLLARYDRVRAKLAKFVGSSTGPRIGADLGTGGSDHQRGVTGYHQCHVGIFGQRAIRVTGVQRT